MIGQVTETGELDSLLGLYGVGSQLATPVALVASATNDSQAAAMGQQFREGGMAALAGAALARMSRLSG